MKSMIIYKGRYGATRQYAGWLSEILSVPVLPAGSENKSGLSEAGYIIVGTSVYIGKLQVSKWLNENKDLLQGKKIFFFLVSGTPPGEREKLQAYINAGIPAEILPQCELFFLPGRLVKKLLSWKDRFMLTIGAKLTRDPNERKNMLTDYDHVRKENLDELVIAVRRFSTVDAASFVTV